MVKADVGVVKTLGTDEHGPGSDGAVVGGLELVALGCDDDGSATAELVPVACGDDPSEFAAKC